MPEVCCKLCNKSFYTKPFSLRKGYGVYCSRACYYASVQKGRNVLCEICRISIYRGFKQLDRSKSKKYFCSKSCQTVWRNQQYIGSRHKLWKGGWNIKYRKILLNSGGKPLCLLCHEKDEKIVVVHHIDENRSNNSVRNLVWLCRNCHHLVHYDSLEKQRLFNLLHMKMAIMV